MILLNLSANLSFFLKSFFLMKPQKKEEIKKPENKIVIYIITLFIVIPVIFLIYKNHAIPNKGINEKLSEGVDTTTLNPEEQSAALKEAINLALSKPNETNFINLSLAYYNRAMYDECIKASREALKYNSKSYYAYNNLCSAYNQLGMWDEAIAAGKKALEILPGDQLATNNLNISLKGKENQNKK